MPQFRITGGKPLNGDVQISGRKNAALKLLAASLLTTGTTTLTHVSLIGDVLVMTDILRSLGATITQEGETFTISTADVTTSEIPYDLGRKLRASLVLVGPLLARFGEAHFPHPGGCVIGKRSIEPHLEGFKKLGATIDFDGTYYHLKAPQLVGQEMYLQEKSVTATENIMMAAVRATGSTHLINAAEEEHIGNLANLLRAYGYTITGDGSSQITITGTQELSSRDASIKIIPDEIEIGTFAVAALVTGGEITMHGVGKRFGLLPLLAKLTDFKAQYTYNEEAETLTIHPSPKLVAADVQTNPWPGFFPDLQSPFVVLATQAEGKSEIHDWMYEGRLGFVELLQQMGADTTIYDPHRVAVEGRTKLRGASNIAPDLRAGAALVLAALAAEGESVIEKVELIDRGYVALDERLRALGAHIIREEV
ncbi:UDP-N-acetylglucosamine 1-carboxyvinyltransferase [soil metagenome]